MPDLDYSQVLVSPRYIINNHSHPFRRFVSCRADSQNTRPEDIETPIVAYVLKNTPLELVRTSTLTPEADTHAPTSHKQNDDPDASLVTLDMIVTELPDLTFDRLSLIPDDQILFFWAETAHFFLSPLSKSNHSSDRGRPIYDEKGEYCGDVGPLPGAVGAVDDDADEEDDFGRDSSSARDAKGTSTSTSNNNQRAEFIALRRFTYICLVLQVERREGIVYRVNIWQIDAQAWRRSRLRRELVALG